MQLCHLRLNKLQNIISWGFGFRYTLKFMSEDENHSVHLCHTYPTLSFIPLKMLQLQKSTYRYSSVRNPAFPQLPVSAVFAALKTPTNVISPACQTAKPTPLCPTSRAYINFFPQQNNAATWIPRSLSTLCGSGA